MTLNEHKTFWQFISPWIDKKYYAFTSFTFLVAICFFYTQYTRPSVNSKNDLLEITGNFVHNSFVDKPGYKGPTHQYYIWLDNYSNAFQIPADFLGIFKAREFINRVNINERLHLAIAKDFSNRLNKSNEKIFVMSIDTDYENFLNVNETIKKENSGFDMYAGLGFLIAGLIYYLVRAYWWKPEIDTTSW